MADSKKYDGSTWEHSLRKLTTATEAVENPLYSDGTAITAYTLKGNEEHTGTPSPQNPVMPNGVGNKTANLFNTFDIVGQVPSVSSGSLVNSPNGATNTMIELSSAQCILTVAYTTTNNLYLFLYDENSALIGYKQITTAGSIDSSTISGYSSAKYARVRVDDSATFIADNGTIMLNVGSTAKPFEPYGYKIPISSGGVTTNIYLGNVQSTRRIDKIVYKGSSDEDWKKSSTAHNGFYIAIPNHEASTPLFCNMAQYSADGALYRTAPWYCVSDWTFGISTDSTVIGGTTVEDWKAYLATLYANGTPLTIWHIRPEVNTIIGIVNEPLLKISDVSDIITGSQTTISIPTTDGANSISVDTTVQPSEFTATWTGWHDSSVKEYDGSDWQ